MVYKRRSNRGPRPGLSCKAVTGGPALRESDQSWIPPSRRLAHNGEKQDFSMEVVGSFQSCLKRQINEAVRITSSQADFIMNSKSEFHQAPIVRVVATNGL